MLTGSEINVVYSVISAMPLVDKSIGKFEVHKLSYIQAKYREIEEKMIGKLAQCLLSRLVQRE